MKTIGLSDVTQEQFDSAAETVAAGIKAYNRRLDTRSGTVLRDLLVDPEAAIDSVMSRQIGEVRRSTSLKMLQEAQAAGEDVDQEDIDAILSNFNVKVHSGVPAKGSVKIVVSDGGGMYSVPEGAAFVTVDGLRFVSDYHVIAASSSLRGGSGVVSANAELYSGAAGYFFLVPVTAAEAGSAGNISGGTALTPETNMSSFVMAEAYSDFGGGADVQPLDEIIGSIPTGLSIRGFVNRTAVEGMLRDEFDQKGFPIVAVSAVGYGNSAQIRDRHNVFGVGVGGRVDVYVRNFSDAYSSTAILKGTMGAKGAKGEYSIVVPPGTFPGACWIKSVSDPFSKNEDEDVLGSLAFDAKRTADASGTWHDIDRSSPEAEAIESFNTVWQGFELSLHEVPADIPSKETESGEEEWSAERDFKVTAYCMPQAVELQEFVDRDDVRSVSTDVVVRCPVVCSVSVNAVVAYNPGKPMDEAAAKAAIREYINGLGFVGRITRSEVVQILKNLGAVSVEMPEKDMLYGEIHDARGVRHVLSGDALDVSSISDGDAMLTKDTVVFAAERENIQIKLIPNE